MKPITVVGDHFIQDGQPLQIIAGAMHYFRVHPDYWEDRLRKLAWCGCNALETYVAWNVHEPRPGLFDFSGWQDLPRYIETAAELGLMCIVRPGPYMCSEWDLGGLPSWLLADPGMRLRCHYPPYLDAVDRYLDALMERLVPLQASAGGPIVAMQVENEYGSYGNDKVYLAHLRDGLRARGFNDLLFTSDGPGDFMLEGGTLPDLLKVANFGSDAKGAFAKLREWQPTGPLMCGEFWNGWFDHWTEPHHSRPAAEAAAVLDDMLGMDASVSMYMFHGGTNFGFFNGANHGNGYEPTISSYDDDAPLSEAGDLTPKYHAFREVIAKYHPVPAGPPPAASPKRAYGDVTLTERADLFAHLDRLSRPVHSATPDPMEMVGQDYGFILYRTEVVGPRDELPIVLQECHDRAQVFVDGEYRGVIYRNDAEPTVTTAFGPGPHQLDLLVENMGRVNYGFHLHDRKGITLCARHGQQFLFGWTIYPLQLDDLSALQFAPVDCLTGPAFFRGTFTVDEPTDTFLAVPGFTKGNCWVNGFNLGRHWEVGPQRTLYVPAPLLKTGENELIVLELHQTQCAKAELRDVQDLG
ncbi:MAG: glycoside hydrolase family 35 protein [Armatimonadota bacterium]